MTWRRLSALFSALGLAFAVAACGGGSAGSPTPSGPVYPATAAASTALGYHQTETLALGPVSGGLAASLVVPFAESYTLGTVTATLSTSLPAGVPQPASARRLTQSIGTTAIRPLGFVALSTTSTAQLFFYGNPTMTFSLPAPGAATNAYLAAYDPQVGWFVAAPAQPLAPTMTFTPVSGSAAVSAQAGYVYMLFAADGAVSAPPPTPTPSPAPVVGTLALNPSVLKLGGILPATCPSPTPSATKCYDGGESAFQVDRGNTAAAVHFAPLTGVSGPYTVTADDPSKVALTQPVADPAGGMVFGVAPGSSVGSTTVRLHGPNGATASLPVSITTLTITLDTTQVPATTGLEATIQGAGGGMELFDYVNFAHSPSFTPTMGGVVYTLDDIPAYAEVGTVNGSASSETFAFFPYAQLTVGLSTSPTTPQTFAIPLVEAHANAFVFVVSP